MQPPPKTIRPTPKNSCNPSSAPGKELAAPGSALAPPSRRIRNQSRIHTHPRWKNPSPHLHRNHARQTPHRRRNHHLQHHRKKCQTSWFDSFHMNYGILFSEGAPAVQGFTVTGQYDTGVDRPNLGLENRLPTHRPRPPDDHRLQHHAQRTRIQSTRNHLHPHQALNRDHPTAFRKGEAPAEPMQIDRAGNRCRYKPLRLFPLQTGAIHCPFRRGSPQKPPSKCVQLIQIPCRTLLNLALTLLNFG